MVQFCWRQFLQPPDVALFFTSNFSFIMKISEYAVENYQFTLVIFLMIVALGITTLLTMPRAEDPEIDAPQFPIVVVYPGTSPTDMEELVVEPIEERIFELEDIKRIRTTINDGVAV